MVYVNHVPSQTSRGPSSGKPALTVIGVFLSASILGSCSQVPDAVNPAEWYRGTVDFFAGEDGDDKKKKADQKDSALTADRGKAPPGSEQPFPKLSSVDRQARARDDTGGLSADPERPKYAPAIQRQGASTATVQARPAPVPAPAVQPPPRAVPTAPVARMPAPPVMAKPSPAPKFTSPAMTTDQKATELRLARQLAEIRARASALADVPVTSRTAAGQAGQETIVISSDGIQTLGAMAAETSLPSAPMAPPSGDTGDAASTLLDSRAASPVMGPAVKVATILFDNGSYQLKDRDRRILDAVARLQRKKGGQIRVVGHASARTRNLSPVKHKMANFKVSVDRADTVAGELMRLGIKKKDVQIAAVSDAEPIYYEFMPSGEAGNRRTEVYLVN